MNRKINTISFILLTMCLYSVIKLELIKNSEIDLIQIGSAIETIGQNNSFDFDDEDYFYILDRIKKVLHKFNQSGNYIKEIKINFSDFKDIYGVGTINIQNDTIYISDSFNHIILKFSTDGTYLSQKNIKEFNVSPFWPISFGGFRYINSGTLRKKFEYEKDGAKFIKEISLLDRDFNFIKTVVRDSIIMDKSVEYDPSNYGLLCFNSNKYAYIYRTSKVLYKVEVYDRDGNFVYFLEKPYQKIEYTEKEKKRIAEAGASGSMKHKVEFKNSISTILADKYGRVWVRSPVQNSEDGKYYDVFEENRYIGRQKLGIENDEVPRFIKDKIVCFSYLKNKIIIYDY